ncbi:MAG: ABC transporter ATP-binding protein [Planctomycetota bacterium]
MSEATPAIRRVVPRLLGYVARHRGLMAWSLVAMIAAAGVELLLPYVIKLMADGPIRDKNPDALPGYALAIVIVLVVGAVIRGAQTVLSVRAGREIGMSLRTDVFEHLQRHSLRFFDRHPVGVLTTRVTGDIESIEGFFASGVAAAFHDALKLLVILVVLLVVNAKLALGLLATLPLLVAASALFSVRSGRAFRRVRAETSATNGYTAESIDGLTVTRLFQREAAAVRGFEDHVDRLRGAHLATVRNFAFFFPTVQALESLAVALVVQLGATGLLNHTLSFGEFLQFWFLIEIFFDPIRNLSENLNLLLQAGAAGERVFKILDEQPEIVSPEDGVRLDELKGDIAFEKVEFAYEEDTPVLRGIDAVVPAGTTTAIVGPTGAGKSSLLGLVSRFYDVQHGRVTVDGVDVRKLDLPSLRRRVALVLQDVFLFRGSVLENIRLFDETISRERVEQAVAAIRADKLVAQLPGGLDAPVEERGGNLSVGQRQLIAFARALVHDPAILVLDEATSSIDTETEHWIQEALATLRSGRTTLVVAHRLSTIRSADQILVLQKGRIVERGRHDDLLRQGGLYRTLYELQVRSEG